jgi:carotenoid cleavage dioxygenase-like enzyme
MKGDVKMIDDYKKGFADQTKEITASSLEVEGVIPHWLSGTLVRNDPARFCRTILRCLLDCHWPHY